MRCPPNRIPADRIHRIHPDPPAREIWPWASSPLGFSPGLGESSLLGAGPRVILMVRTWKKTYSNPHKFGRKKHVLEWLSGWWCDNHLEKYESQWEGLSHILWKIRHVPNHQPVTYPLTTGAPQSRDQICSFGNGRFYRPGTIVILLWALSSLNQLYCWRAF